MLPSGVCFNMVKQIEFNGHTPLLNMKVTILKQIESEHFRLSVTHSGHPKRGSLF
jgi:hypothetical protein